jgi:hypothetical protein
MTILNTHISESRRNAELTAPASAFGAASRVFQAANGFFARVNGWIQSRKMASVGSKRLHATETVSLGEKRFVSLIQVDGLKFLVGGGPTSVGLLAQLGPNDAFVKGSTRRVTVRKQVTKPLVKQRNNHPKGIASSVGPFPSPTTDKLFGEVLMEMMAVPEKAETMKKPIPKTARKSLVAKTIEHDGEVA